MVMRANTPRPSGTIARPCLSNAWLGTPLMDLPRYSASPLTQPCRPVIAFMVVVLPAPLAPISVTSSPSRISMSMPLMAWIPP